MVDPEVLTQLFNAAVNDRVEELEDLIGKNGVDINVCQKDGSTLLMMAAQCCAMKCVQKLIELGADINASIEDWTALMYACDNSDDAIAVALVNAGAICSFPPTVGPSAVSVVVVNAIMEREKNAKKTAAEQKKLQEEASKPKESWLHIFLTENDIPEDTARISAQKLIQQGFYSPRLLARVPPHMFDVNYLHSLGIVGRGLQLLLTGLHAELHALFKSAPAKPLWIKSLNA